MAVKYISADILILFNYLGVAYFDLQLQSWKCL